MPLLLLLLRSCALLPLPLPLPLVLPDQPLPVPRNPDPHGGTVSRLQSGLAPGAVEHVPLRARDAGPAVEVHRVVRRRLAAVARVGALAALAERGGQVAVAGQPVLAAGGLVEQPPCDASLVACDGYSCCCCCSRRC
ncbi:uncharacterized protein B0I36DRAFT_347293 [Microdochium trichocladiopsis]|uniref:Secreted protein n=1 Tax=Microdochium trichocladiopsis TaxID=1682393 RepID=A0A9P8YEH1_9PEZI|nr:uncharacterized protein B0I36DRAFT_347293 [Microdochium trichocladiopsis]KAH7035538.1 hypothetical protein B0I36DRAFT_347293 [Microdochium trichocladiopsis]